jgi:hypothetical protein
MGYILKLFRNKQYCLITGNIIEIELADEISATEPTKIYSLSEKNGTKAANSKRRNYDIYR